MLAPDVSVLRAAFDAEHTIRRVALQGRTNQWVQGAGTPLPPPGDSATTQRIVRPELINGLAALTTWLARTPASEWRSLPAHESDQRHMAAYYRRAALVLHCCAVLPMLRAVVALDALPGTRDTHALLAQWAGPDDRPGAPVAVGAAQRAAHQTDDALDVFAHLTVYHTLATVQRYRMFQTPHDAVRAVEAELRWLSGVMDAVAPPVAEFTHAAPLERTGRQRAHTMRAVRGLLSYHRGRVARADAGAAIADATTHFAQALALYEERAAAKVRQAAAARAHPSLAGSRQVSAGSAGARHANAGDERGGGPPDLFALDPYAHTPDNDEHHLAVSCYRAALVTLQQGYLALLNGQLREAEGRLRTARLLALSITRAEGLGFGNELTEAEIELVDLSVQRRLLRATDPSHGAQSAAIARRLEQLIPLYEAFHEPMLAQMARFQAALCHAYPAGAADGADAGPAMRYADQLLREATAVGRRRRTGRPEPTSRPDAAADEPEDPTYWHASGLMLKLSLLDKLSRQAEAPAVRRRYARNAAAQGVDALAVIGRKRGFDSLRVNIHAHLARVAVTLDDPLQAEEQLRHAEPATTPTGYTSEPFVSAMLVLTRAELALSRDALPDALAHLARFRDTMAPHLDVGWLHEWHDELRAKAEHQDLRAFVITDEMLRTAQARLPGDRMLTYEQLKTQLVRYLLRATFRIHGGRRVNDTRMAGWLGTTPRTVRDLYRRHPDIAQDVAQQTAPAEPGTTRPGLGRRSGVRSHPTEFRSDGPGPFGHRPPR